MSNAHEALEALRRKGMRISTERAEALARLREAQQNEDPEFESEEDLFGPSDVRFTHEEHPVRSIKVLEMNFGNIKLELDGVDRTQEEIDKIILMLVEAMCMLKREIGEIRLDDCPF